MAIELKLWDSAYIQQDDHGKIWIDGQEVIGWSLEYFAGIPVQLVPVLKPNSDEIAHRYNQFGSCSYWPFKHG
jgi:hypothetical protein